MKRILIIGSLLASKKNDVSKIADSIRLSGINVTVVYWEDLLFKVETNSVSILSKNESIINDKPDLVIALGWYKNGKKTIYRDMAFSLALFLRHNDIRFWNSEMINQRSTTKLSCMVQLALEGISIPRTYFSLNVSQTLAMVSMPFIAKAAAASRGDYNYLIATDADISQINDKKDVNFILQPYLINDHDLRVICFNGVPNLVLKRSRGQDAETHLNNTSQGGNASWLSTSSIPSELLTLSQKICKVTGREMAGIDFIPDSVSSVGYSCLEVNAIPQLTSGIDSDQKMQALVNALKGI